MCLPVLNDNTKIILSLLLLIGAGIMAYGNSFSGAFVFDDVKAIVENTHLRRLLPLKESLTGPWDSAVRDRPIVSLTLALNYAAGGLRTGGYHLFNLAVHIIAGLTLFGLLRRTFLSPVLSNRYHRASVGLSLAISLIWIVHPLQTGSVTYIIQRSESLGALFYLLTLYFFARGQAGRRTRFWFVLSVLACAFGMGTKAMMITAPLLVLAYDAVFCSRSLRKAITDHRILYLALAGTWIIEAAIVFSTRYDDLKGLSTLAYLFTQPGVICHYLWLSFWPHPLCLDYGWPLSRSVAGILLPSLAVGILLSAVIFSLYKRPALGFLGIWFFLILAPTSSILPLEDPAFEHRMYLPLAAVITGCVVGIFELRRKISTVIIRIGTAVILLTAVTLLFIALTRDHNRIYRDPLLLWENVVHQRPAHARAHYNYGLELIKAGRREEAIREYRAAVSLKPDYADAYNNLGAAVAEKGEFLRAIAHYTRALEKQPDFWRARYNMGIAFLALGKEKEALACFSRVLDQKPDCAPAFYQEAILFAKQGKRDRAIAYYRQAAALNPEYRQTMLNYGVELANSGERESALLCFKSLLSMFPKYQPALEALRVVQHDLKNTR